MSYQKITPEQFLEQMEQYSKWYSDLPQLAQEILDYVSGGTSTMPQLNNHHAWYFSSAVNLLNLPDAWTEMDKNIIKLIVQHDQNWQKGKPNPDYYFGRRFMDWVEEVIREYPQKNYFPLVVDELKRNGLNDACILEDTISELKYVLMDREGGLTGVGEYVLSFLPEKESQILGWVKSNNDSSLNTLLGFLLKHREQTVEDRIENFLEVYNGYYSQTYISVSNIELLLQHNAQKYEPAIKKALHAGGIGAASTYEAFEALAKHLPDEYESKRLEAGFTYLITQKKEANPDPIPTGYWYYSEGSKRIPPANPNEYWKYIPYCVYIIDYLLEKDPVNAKTAAVEYLKDNTSVKSEFLTTLEKHLQGDAVDILIEGIYADPGKVDSDYFRTLLGILSKYDYKRHEEKVWALTRHKSKRLREIVAVTLSKLGDSSIAKAEQLLADKKGDVRQAGALILSLIGTDTAKSILSNALNAEKNDDARDVMLQALGEKLFEGASEETIKEMVAATKKRGKIEKPVEDWLLEKDLPALYYKSGDRVDENTIRFLLYRMGRSKDIRPDIEAKPLLLQLDREKSGDFAKKLYELFIQKGSDSKQKYLLALAGLLGNDDLVDKLKAQVNQLVEANRGKMGEYTVQALALIGSNKALRAVEFLSRKYKSKNRNVGAAAMDAFKIAAEELNISFYELADSIIPDFGFEGLFKSFVAKDQEYRAFIDTDFKLAFFDEDNRKFKSLPKGTAKEIQDEFKEIGKEVRDIVKSQSGRMEQYLVIQRKWDVETWQGFFTGNPIMFVYAVRLLWGAYDAQGNLLYPFMVMEDTSLINLDDEEVMLEDGVQLGMVHPLSLSEDDLQAWKTKLFDYGMEPIFPQLDRAIVRVEDKDQNVKISNEFDKKKISSYAFGGQMEKLGWARGSVVDGGYVSGYYKAFPESAIEVFIETDGIYVGGYYEDSAYLSRLYFVKMGAVAIGNYTYDEPSNEKDERLIAFGDVPAIIYSEVMSDLKQVIIPEEKQQEELQEA
ncbi:DUF4132 domain-containing protein [Cytophagaceae bacterium DM2B3-1]|uniref:DUF4132 domain-containing protein n=1 Tax=Xanthocytophaga flava TaxID=3048013 RepID=A0ABT7CW10_9BACT|nr:DUF4132 domain-containing protein [Xanthocytophaga flavus]MDJ1497905.1 DUF4132 domain-containing protein [Xanthocytophaga flavus]